MLYALFRLLMIPKPAIPRPTSTSVVGSGTEFSATPNRPIAKHGGVSSARLYLDPVNITREGAEEIRVLTNAAVNSPDRRA